MHPAFSVILFTTLSGAGYGLLFWLGVYAIAHLLPADRLFGLAAMMLVFGSVSVGLLSSTFHLGHPERAWRAFSQWRSSWLSREGVASMTTYIPAAIFGAGWVFQGRVEGVWASAGLAGAVCAVLTVICTAYIYRSLKPISNWHNAWVVPNYVALSAMTGSLLLAMLANLFGASLAGIYEIVLVATIAAFLCKLGYWNYIDNVIPDSTPGTATGLGRLGKVRLFEAPHTSENYLMKEMGFRVARKHARKLRRISAVLAFVLPFVLTATGYATGGAIAKACMALAAASALAGVLTERWLFFAEAKHTVTLYYGRSLNPAHQQ